MAAPMKYARICLNFENLPNEPSWSLVNFERHSTIAGLQLSIRSKYDISENANISLWLKNCILPEHESSQLLRDDDVVVVRVNGHNKREETGKSSRKRKHDSVEVNGEDVQENNISDTPKHKKKKKKHFDEIEDEYQTKRERKQKKKHHEKVDGENQMEIKVKKKSADETSDKKVSCDINLVKPKKTDIKKQNATIGTSKAEEAVEESDSDSEDTDKDNGKTDAGSDTKTKRRRRRKHKRKKKTRAAENVSTPVLMNTSITDEAVKSQEKPKYTYVGKPIAKDEKFYGCLPDKLEPPKYYRHGYRNKKTYDAKPNTHKTFDSDSSDEIEEGSLEQYNFLCKSRKPDSEDKSFDEASVIGINVSDISSLRAGDLSKLLSLSPKNSQPANKQADATYSSKDLSLDNQYFNGFDNENTNIANQSQQIPNARPNARTNDQVHPITQSPNSKPDIGYSRMTPEASSATVSASPTLLTRKTLASGVSVFTRQRNNSPKTLPARIKTLTKEEQLNDVATNVSTILVNPADGHFKIPESPKVGRTSKTSTPTVSPLMKPIPAVKDVQQQPSPSNSCQATSDHDLSSKPIKVNGSVSPSKTSVAVLSNLPALEGLPTVGQKIAYKVLEVSATCTPEVSDFKLAEVLGVGEDQMIELHNVYQSAKGPNRFSMEIEYEDEILTNMDQPQERVSLHISSMLDTRVIS